MSVCIYVCLYVSTIRCLPFLADAYPTPDSQRGQDHLTPPVAPLPPPPPNRGMSLISFSVWNRLKMGLEAEGLQIALE